MKVKSESEDTQLRLTHHDPMDCSLPGSSIHGIFQARVLEWVAITFSVLQSMGSQRVGCDLATEQQFKPALQEILKEVLHTES